ncbi:ABC-type dipeptide/oligopeptide/nickel transport system ATPase component [Maritalea mobilis]|uniref:ABC-type dipeptide/oligopeptide/nickel transport system ATPase component n=1 Tax=Maritalea mobilis TaxID=483324 RepID=A0A4R6VKA0_9HYPH|nr:dipeptide/oligopeptide/nickel ABC transporter permease/ATP-binding protein [Maritalea mobilis]TDQ62038.1 ABC-type dipeptide/oligopeptide/nickel transport system ATPase component [Maritalea mobilis]
MSIADKILDQKPNAPVRTSITQRFFQRKAGVTAFTIFILVVLMALLAPWISPHDPNFVQLANTKAPPSAEHWLGGDSAGRDILSRIIWGARTTLFGAAITIITALAVGVTTGVMAGFFGGLVDRVFSWLSDATQAIPGMIILLVVAAGTRSNFPILMATVGVFMAPGYFRITRSATLAIVNEPYIDAAKVAGLTAPRIIARHVLPGIYAPIIIQTALAAGISMGIQAGLQFLGVGSANTPSWGAMMNEGFRFMLTNPTLLLWPSAALGITIAALATIGSTLAEVVRVRTPVVSETEGEDDKDWDPAQGTGAFAHDKNEAIVRLKNLRVFYQNGDEQKTVVNGISFDVKPGEVLGIVGESGSGKSQTIFSLLNLLPKGGKYVADQIEIAGKNVNEMTGKDRAKILGSQLGYIPQEPMSNLDPTFTIGHQLTEPLRLVFGQSKAEATAKAKALLARVGINDVDRVMKSYPHQISGGMAQRVLIAGAIAGQPSVLLADEPTTALDVTVQAEVLELLRELQQEFGMALILVTHNFGVVADICDRVVVMREGAVVEMGEVEQIFAQPKAQYTQDLIDASLDGTLSRKDLDASETSNVHILKTAGGGQK